MAKTAQLFVNTPMTAEEIADLDRLVEHKRRGASGYRVTRAGVIRSLVAAAVARLHKQEAA
jgi:hypothetical protein